jgi:hypothetical protein
VQGVAEQLVLWAGEALKQPARSRAGGAHARAGSLQDAADDRVADLPLSRENPQSRL